MPLNKSLRDEEKERICNILKKLNELIFVPDFEKEAIENQLKFLGLNLEVLVDFSGKELISHLEKFHFDWENTERFADFIADLADKISSEKQNLIKKALLIYNYIQSESKTFSFEISGKIGVLKEKI